MVSNIPVVQKQSLDLEQITIKVSGKFMNKEEVPMQTLKQNRFNEHYCSDRHTGIEDWVITLVDSAGRHIKRIKEERARDVYETIFFKFK